MGFIYNDTSSADMGLKARLTSWQVCGNLRNYTASIPGKSGIADFGADFDYREINVSCSIPPKRTFAALVSVLDDIALWLDPAGGLKQLIFDDVPDRYFMARLSEKADCERLLIRSAGSFNLKFLCPDPFAYAVEDEEVFHYGSGDAHRQTNEGKHRVPSRLPHQGRYYFRYKQLHHHYHKRLGTKNCKRRTCGSGNACGRYGHDDRVGRGCGRQCPAKRSALPFGTEFSLA